MKILGIDFGLKRTGFAISEGFLSEPFTVLSFLDNATLAQEVKEMCEKERIEKIVVGISEGIMAEKTKEFLLELKKIINIPIDEFDETLSTHDAQELSIQAHMKRSKRRQMIDAMAAAVMLQNYLDTR